MTTTEEMKRSGSSSLLIVIGVLWLLLAAAVLYFQLGRPASIDVEWNTATELETAGFNLYRSQSPNNGFEQINDTLIPSEGSATSGATYLFTDESVTPGETYYYLLEEVEYDATTNRYENDIFSHTVPQATWQTAALTAVSLLAGLAMLIMGIRERR